MEPRDEWPEPPPALPSEPSRPNWPPPVAPEEPGGPTVVPYGPDYPTQYTTVRREPPPPQVAPPPQRRGMWVARTKQFIYLALGILEILLIIRFMLKLLAANPYASFTSFMYAITEPFVAPFEGVFPSPQTNGGLVLDVAAVLAMIVYALLVWLIVSIIDTVARRPARPAP
jgi:uncharacterized protein YggT (Ycf19 family)